MTDHDAARLAEIREWHANHDWLTVETVEAFLLRLLDAAAQPHDASFVTRAMYDAADRQITDHRVEILSLRKQVELAERCWDVLLQSNAALTSEKLADRERIAELEAACARHVTAYDEIARRVVELEAERQELLKWAFRILAASNGISDNEWRTPDGTYLPHFPIQGFATLMREFGKAYSAALRPAEEKPTRESAAGSAPGEGGE